jgi:D-alanyl-lipoteichoic acid acyltransferase DltB (MBOAT superfamily)
MSFTSVTFFGFCALAAICYYAVPPRVRWICLLVFSYVFYWVSSGWLVFFIACATVGTYCAGRALDGLNRDQVSAKSAVALRKRLILVLALVFDLAFLIVFKYGGFIVENVGAAFGLGALPIESLVMPIGISFYTFQAMGYLIDIYRGQIRADRNPAQLALFLAYFPQIVQGPIARHSDLAHQLYAGNGFDYERARSGLLLIAYGLFKKLVIADRIGVFVIDVFDKGVAPADGTVSFTAALFYSMQLYCDFSGGIDIARGFSRVLGIELAENFRRPYYSCSLGEFWRRWHITLGGWMRDYIFYPILLSASFQKFSYRLRHGSRLAVVHKVPQALATFVVFMAVGIWHGAAWHWVAFAVFNAAVISASVVLEPVYDRFHKATRIPADHPAWVLFMRARTLLIRCVSLTFARALTLSQAWAMLAGVVTSFSFSGFGDGFLLAHGLDVRDYVILGVSIAALFVVSLRQEHGRGVAALITERPAVVRWTGYVAIAAAIVLLSADASGGGVNFIYGRY